MLHKIQTALIAAWYWFDIRCEKYLKANKEEQ